MRSRVEAPGFLPRKASSTFCFVVHDFSIMLIFD